MTIETKDITPVIRLKEFFSSGSFCPFSDEKEIELTLCVLI
jgi:hypothetical protein